MAKLGRILIVDDDEDVLIAARLLLKSRADEVATLSKPEAIPPRFRDRPFDVVLLDMNFTPGVDTGAEGLAWLQKIKEISPQTPVVMITAYGDVETAVKAMKAGASDFIEKPWTNERLIATLTTAYELGQSRAEADDLRARHKGLAASLAVEADMVGQAPSMRRVFEMIRRAAPTDANVLILGENGTGKDLVARAIHKASARAAEVFLSVDLGAVSESLFESELFGHKKGAFTDAKEDRIGRFQAASSGTLFLDEIGNLPMHLQAKLLRVLEERAVVPLGANKPTPVDVRLICATNRPMAELMDESCFRQDLLYRVNTVEISLPPLRDRKDDVPALVEHFVGVYTRKYNLQKKRVSPEAMARLVDHDWPGNVRALRHALERALILAEGDELKPGDFALAPAREAKKADDAVGSLNLDAVEKQAIERVLKKHGHNISRAADELGLTRASLYRRMEKYGL